MRKNATFFVISTLTSILTMKEAERVKSEATNVFSGKFYVSYQVLIALEHLEVTFRLQ